MFVRFLSFSSARSLITIIMAVIGISPLLVLPSAFVIDSVCFILNRDASPLSLSHTILGNLLKTFSQSKNNSSKLLVVYLLSLLTKLEKQLDNKSPHSLASWGWENSVSDKGDFMKLNFIQFTGKQLCRGLEILLRQKYSGQEN